MDLTENSEQLIMNPTRYTEPLLLRKGLRVTDRQGKTTRLPKGGGRRHFLFPNPSLHVKHRSSLTKNRNCLRTAINNQSI